MCGIVGVCHFDKHPVTPSLLKKMTDAIAHRGPDGEGQWHHEHIGIGHRRLAIIDLTAAGAQPMLDRRGLHVLTYNGEVYNFRELREELRAMGREFVSQTDTEVVLQAYHAWGPSCVKRFNGMFAFAIWDSENHHFFLARDRYGVKPLYWYHDSAVFAFASEVKALLQHPGIKPRVCDEALNDYFTFQNVFSDRTLFEGVRLLPAGCTLTVRPDRTAEPQAARYWDLANHADLTLSESDAADMVYRAFMKGTERQLVSDVPVGAYLSGGIDSGSITAVAGRSLPHLATFTCGFDLSSASGLELGFDERANARAMSELFGTEPHEIVTHAGDMEKVLPSLVWHLEDLRVGQSYPNYLVAGLARQSVKVVLSGVGGDELFAGYPWRYFRGTGSQNRGDYLKRYYGFWQRLVGDEDKATFFNDATHKRIGKSSSFESFRQVFDLWDGPFQTADDFVQASIYFEFKTFLPGLLVVEDKLSMAHSLEARVPFLDNDLVDVAQRIPVAFKLRDLHREQRVDENLAGKRLLAEREFDNGKLVLRKAMSRLIPPSILDRAKQGFSAPDASWFRGESIDYVNRLLTSRETRLYEYLNPTSVQRILQDHISGRQNLRLLIWSLISFEWWLRLFLK